MNLRVIDYVANPGGGLLFTLELLKALLRTRPEIETEVVSYGSALTRYKGACEAADMPVTLRAIRPARYWKHQPATRMVGIPGTGQVKRMLGYGSDWRIEVPSAAVEHCDAAWFPWLPRHYIPLQRSERVVATFHDAIIFMWPGMLPQSVLDNERGTVERWISSQARIAVGSRATQTILSRLFNVAAQRFVVVPPAGNHITAQYGSVSRPTWLGTFILCPANTSPHKNHEGLFQAFADWGCKVPLVLTGYGTDLADDDRRGADLRRLAGALGIRIGQSLVPLGYVSTEVYRSLMAAAWAVVMPSFMEGGGSFPVLEAMYSGVPVLCADIPVMREQIERTGGEVLWFDPRDPRDIVRRLEELERAYDATKEQAGAQVASLRRWAWTDVAEEYWTLMNRRTPDHDPGVA